MKSEKTYTHLQMFYVVIIFTLLTMATTIELGGIMKEEKVYTFLEMSGMVEAAYKEGLDDGYFAVKEQEETVEEMFESHYQASISSRFLNEEHVRLGLPVQPIGFDE